MAKAPQLLKDIDAYVEALFVPRDETLDAVLRDSVAAGLPPINVSPNEGRILYLLAKIAGARRILELGLLGGYSTIWLARALPEDGRLVSLELDSRCAAVARKNLERAGVHKRVEIRLGPALDSLKQMASQGEPGFDLVFIDADKTGYPAYLDACLKLVHSGSVIIGDNCIRNGAVVLADATTPDVRAIQQFNRMMASNPRLESIAIPLIRESIDGIAIARVVR